MTVNYKEVPFTASTYYEVMEMPFTSEVNLIGSHYQWFGRAYQGR